MYRIIIVDDEREVRELLAKNINRSQTDFQVIGQAEDGKEAVRLVEELKPDILITDICMPFVSGLDLIRQIQELEHPVKTVIISGYDDFSYAKQAVTLGVTEYLLKPFSPDELYEVLDKIKEELERQRILMNNVQEMKAQLEVGRQLLQEQAVRRLLRKEASSETVREMAESAGICLEHRLCAVGILRVYHNLPNQDRDIKDLLAMVKDSYFQKNYQTYLTRLNEKQIVMLFLGDYRSTQIFQRTIKEDMTMFEESLEKYYDLKAYCIIGSIYDNWNRIPDSYKEAMSVWKGTLECPEAVVFYENQKNRKSAEGGGRLQRPRELEQQLLIHIQLGQEERAVECLDEILQYYKNLDMQQGDFVSISLVELVFEISGTLTKIGGQGQVWEDENVVEYLKDHFAYSSLKDAGEMLQAYILKCCRQLNATRERQGERIAFQVKELIEQHLDDEEFGLETVSGKLFFSPNYVRQIFKQITGESFMEYLIRRRMELARELLKNSPLKIQDVAMRTGYSNQRYFSSFFKKYYGYTPTEYRNQLERGQESCKEDQNGENGS